jgi:hypothetical protein
MFIFANCPHATDLGYTISTGPHSSHKARGRTCRNGGGR